jgi:hypothetical protein
LNAPCVTISLPLLAPKSAIFLRQVTQTTAGRQRQVQSCLGLLSVSHQQAIKLGLKPRVRLSPLVEKSCLLLSANVSYENAERDLKLLTGVSVSHSTQQRLVQRSEWIEPRASESVEALSIDGGKVRLRTPKGEPSQWRDYKAVSLHKQLCGAWLQQNQMLIDWVNRQPLAAVVTCLGDGHDGVWNLMAGIRAPEHRREILDWYHLVENLYKVGGSLHRLAQIKAALWQGQSQLVQAAFANWQAPQVEKFLSYLAKHEQRIPPYQSYQQAGICIGSGAVESTIKRIGLRLKLSGAQWKQENVAQVLKQRCAYLNLSIA